MKVLVTGAAGQLGRALLQSVPDEFEVFGLDRASLDVGDSAQVDEVIARERPALIINAAAYTAVDKAEDEAAKAARANTQAPAHLAAALQRHGGRLIQVSTDFVFDGARGSPYLPEDQTNPLNVYGRTKREGEVNAGAEALIVRTSWVYSAWGTNFVRTMLRLMSERSELSIVADQIGTPTRAQSLAETLWRFAQSDLKGIFHWTDSGVASWYDFAAAIEEDGSACGLLTSRTHIRPIPSRDYPTAARRPSFSVLDKSKSIEALGHTPPHWRVNLRKTLAEIRDHG